jgi:hypothetical protein
MKNDAHVVLGSASRSGTTTSQTFNNYEHRGAHVLIDVTVAPGTDTVTPKIQGYDPTTDTYYDILVGSAIDATGTTVLKVYPGIAAVANGSASDFLPTAWRVVMTHSAATDFTYSVSVNLEV